MVKDKGNKEPQIGNPQVQDAQNLKTFQNPQSLQSLQKIQSLIQDLVSETLQESQRRCPAQIRPPTPLTSPAPWFERTSVVRGRPLHYPFVGSGWGSGPYVESVDGSVKLDLINGIGIHILGHAHPEVIQATIEGALSDVVNQGNLQPNVEYTLMLEKLVSIASRSSRLRHGWLTTCGTMANENALKMARQKTSPARYVLCFKNAFAGRSTMMAELTDNPSYKSGLPEYHEMLRLSFYNKSDPRSGEKTLRELHHHLEKHAPSEICAFSFEPMQGEGGYNVAPREFFLPLLDFCRSQKIPIWVDEVQTFSRTGEFFAFHTLGLGEYIDLCTIAKTIQVGCVLFTEEMNPRPGLVAGTFSGSTPALRAGLRILEILDQDGYMGPQGKIQRIHNQFIAMLKELAETSCQGLLRDPEGLGLMIAVTPLDGTKEKVDQLTHRLFERGLITYTCGKNPVRIRFLPPAILGTQDIQVIRNLLEEELLKF